jgi:hypothetical protein
MVHDLRALLRRGEGRADDPTAAILDSHTAQSTPPGTCRNFRATAKHASPRLPGSPADLMLVANSERVADREPMGSRNREFGPLPAPLGPGGNTVIPPRGIRHQYQTW